MTSSTPTGARAGVKSRRQDRRRGARRPLAPALSAWARRGRPREQPTHIGGARGREDGAAEGGGRRGGASAHEAMSTKDIAAFEGERERAEAAEIAERFARAMRARLTRRERARRRGRRLDLRSDDPAQRRAWRRAARPQVPPAQDQAAAARGAARRLRLDGALCRLLHPLPARGEPGVSRVRGVPVSYQACACLVGAERARSGARARPARADGGRRRRRDEDRRMPDRLQSRGTPSGPSIRAPA